MQRTAVADATQTYLVLVGMTSRPPLRELLFSGDPLLVSRAKRSWSSSLLANEHELYVLRTYGVHKYFRSHVRVRVDGVRRTIPGQRGAFVRFETGVPLQATPRHKLMSQIHTYRVQSVSQHRDEAGPVSIYSVYSVL